MADSARLDDRKNAEKFIAPQVGRKNLAKLCGCVTYAGDPTNNVTPQFIGEFCHDTTNAALYWASTSAAAGWKKLTP